MVAQVDRSYFRASAGRSVTRLISYALFEGRPLTTRGRWINPLVFANAHRAARSGSGSPDRPVFIIGTGRSGTTILGVVLSMHRDVGFLNEPKALWHAACPFEDLAGSYTDEPARYRIGADDVTPAAAAAMQHTYAHYQRFVAARRVVDKYPELVFRIPYVLRIFEDARFLLLVRDGAATCESVARWSQRFATDTSRGRADWWGLNDRKWRCLVEQVVSCDSHLSGRAGEIAALENGVDRAAVEWIVSMKEGLLALRNYPDRVMRVDYESLVSSPREALTDIAEFAGLDTDTRMLEYAESVLRPPGKVSYPELATPLEAAFADTMRELGYAKP